MRGRETDDANVEYSDKELVRLCLSGQKEAFSRLVLRYQGILYGFVILRVKEPNIAEDIVQDSFLRAYRSLDKCTRPEGFSKWIFTLTSNLCKDYLKNPRRTEISLDRAPISSEPVAHPQKRKAGSEERFARVQSLTETLPYEMQIVLAMKHQEQMSCTEIARALGKPVGTVTSLLSRAYAILREKVIEKEREDK